MTFAAKIEVRLPKMNSQSFEALLDRAAALCGIEPEYWDIFGRHHVTTTQAKQAILRAMGWAAGSAEELEKSLADHARREWQRLAPATVVAMEADDVDLPLHLPAESLGETVTVTVRREDGAADTFSFSAGELPQTGSIDMEGRTWVRKRARLPIRFAGWDITRSP